MKKQTNKQEEKDLQEVWKRICKVLDKQKFVLILLLFSLSVSAQFSVQPRAAFEYGIGNGFIWEIHQPYHPYEFGNFRAKSGIDFIYRKVSLEFDTHIYMWKANGYQFAPTRADFFVNLSYSITDKIKVYAENLCMHPVVTDGLLNKSFNGGYTSIGISYGY